MSDTEQVCVVERGDFDGERDEWVAADAASPLPPFMAVLYDPRRLVPRDLWERYQAARAAFDEATAALATAAQPLPATRRALEERDAERQRAAVDAYSASRAYDTTRRYLFAKGIHPIYGRPLTLPDDP